MNKNVVKWTFILIFDHLFDRGIYIIANKMGTASLPNGMQGYWWYAGAIQKNPEQLYDFSNVALTTLVENYGIENGDRTDICSDSVLHVICS